MEAGELPEQPAAVIAPETYGLAGSYFVFGDAWPLPFLGLGLEWNRAGSTMVTLFDADAHDSHNAIRGRVSLRGFVGARGTLSATASIGRGTFADFPITSCTSEEEPGCLDHPSGNRPGETTRGAGLSFGGQLAAHGRYGPNGRVTFGVVLRADVVVPAAAVSFGPTLGFEI